VIINFFLSLEYYLNRCFENILTKISYNFYYITYIHLIEKRIVLYSHKLLVKCLELDT